MHRTAAALVSTALIGLLAGCTASGPQPVRSSSSAPAPHPSPTVAALRIPPHTADEVLRSTITPGAVREEVADSHGVRSFLVHAACSGPTRSTMRWTLEDGKGRLIVGSTADCTGTEEGADWSSPGAPPATLQLALEPNGHVTAGYAVLTRG